MKKLLLGFLVLFIIIGCSQETPQPTEEISVSTKPLVTTPTSIPKEESFLNAKDDTTVTDLATEILMFVKDEEANSFQTKTTMIYEVARSVENASGALAYTMHMLNGKPFQVTANGTVTIKDSKYIANDLVFTVDTAPGAGPIYVSGNIIFNGKMLTGQPALAAIQILLSAVGDNEHNIIVNHQTVGNNGYIYSKTISFDYDSKTQKADIEIKTPENVLRFGHGEQETEKDGSTTTQELYWYFSLDDKYYDAETWDVIYSAYKTAGGPDFDQIT